MKAGIVLETEQYIYSSAIDYSGAKYLVDIEILDIHASLVGYVYNGWYGKVSEYGLFSINCTFANYLFNLLNLPYGESMAEQKARVNIGIFIYLRN